MPPATTNRLSPKPETAEEHSSFWQNAHGYFDRSYQTMGLEPTWRAVLSSPKRVLTVSCPVRMDDGRIQVFTGYRAGNLSSAPLCCPAFERRVVRT